MIVGWDRIMSHYVEVSLGSMVASATPLVLSCGVNHLLPDYQILKKRYMYMYD